MTESVVSQFAETKPGCAHIWSGVAHNFESLFNVVDNLQRYALVIQSSVRTS